MARLITLPLEQKPTSNSGVRMWMPGGSYATNPTDRLHISGSWKTSDGYSMGENINADWQGGNIYTDSAGWKATVTSKKDQNWYSQHWIADSNVPFKSGSTISGGNLIGSTINANNKASWTKGVDGFICEVCCLPDGSGSAADKCGKIMSMSVSGVFVDDYAQVRVYEMTNGGNRITGQDHNSTLSADWKIMSYYSKTTATRSLFHMGWIISFNHKKTCGGNGEQKNMTGRVRYLQPLISHGGSLSTSAATKQVLMEKPRMWSDRNTHTLLTA
jgi:hypothetical protein